MAEALKLMRDRFDRVGILLSGLCAAHCLATLVLVAALGLGGSILLDPAVHRVGLALAILVGGIGLGLGVARHGRREPLERAAFGRRGLTRPTRHVEPVSGLRATWGLLSVPGTKPNHGC